MSDSIKCPYCAEDIKPDAKKCKHCGEWLVQRSLETRVRQIQLTDQKGDAVRCPNCGSLKTRLIHNRKSTKKWAIGTGIVALLLMAAQPFGMVFAGICLIFVLMLAFAKEYDCRDCKHKWNLADADNGQNNASSQNSKQPAKWQRIIAAIIAIIIGVTVTVKLLPDSKDDQVPSNNNPTSQSTSQ